MGSRLARLTHPEALAVGFAMNARGSTEVILATIGLSMGVLNQQLFTVIVLMAVVTTVCMPPLLRWALERVPIRQEEQARLEAEAAEEKDSLPKLERVLVALDGSDNGRFASRLAGWLIGARDLAATILEMRSTGKDSQAEPQLAQRVIETAEAAAQVLEGEERLHARKTKGESDDPINKGAKTERTPVRELVSIVAVKAQDDTRDNAEAILAEAKKGTAALSWP